MSAFCLQFLSGAYLNGLQWIVAVSDLSGLPLKKKKMGGVGMGGDVGVGGGGGGCPPSFDPLSRLLHFLRVEDLRSSPLAETGYGATPDTVPVLVFCTEDVG